ncbi:hypothetical protein MMC07_007796 [Pseudocyphellaria aurata]|nr:hypothetical protein [Pseudocyphellaria aurata]
MSEPNASDAMDRSESPDSIYDALYEDLDAALASDPPSQRVAAAPEQGQVEHPGPTPEQAAQIPARSRSVERRAEPTASIAPSSSEFTFSCPPLPPVINPGPSSVPASEVPEALVPEPMATDEDEGKAVPFDVLAHERHPAAEEVEGLGNGNAVNEQDRREKQLADWEQTLLIREAILLEEQNRLVGPTGDRTNVLAAEEASQTIASQAQEIARLGRLHREANHCVSGLIFTNQRIKAKAESLSRQLDVKDQERASLEKLLSCEWEARRAIVETNSREWSMKEIAMRHTHARDMQKLQTEHRRELSRLSAHGQPAQPADPLVEQLGQDLAQLKVSNRALPQSLAAHDNTPPPQPPTQVVATKSAATQTGRDQEAEDCKTKMGQQLAQVTAKAAEDRRRSRKTVINLEKNLEDTRAQLEREENTSREARETIRSLKEESRRSRKTVFNLEKNLEDTRAQLEREENTSREAQETIRSLGEESRRSRETVVNLEKDLDAARAQLGREENTSREARGTIRSLKVQEAKLEDENCNLKGAVSRLRDRNGLLEDNLKTTQQKFRNHGWAVARLELELSSSQQEVDRLRGEVQAAREVEEERVREAAALPPKAETGGREMDAPLGATKKVIEGLLRPQFPRWTAFLFLFLGLLLLLVAFPVAWGTSREPHLALARHAVASLPAEEIAVFFPGDARRARSSVMWMT